MFRKQWQEARANRMMQFKVGDFKSSNIRMLTGTLKADWIQLPVERYLAVLPTLKQGVISILQGCSRSKVPLLGRLPGQRSCKSRCSFPMSFPWMTRMQVSMPCPQCGLMFLWWGSTICAGWSAMIFTTYGRSMMCQVCGAMFAHVGDYCSSTLKPRGLDGTRWQKERSGSLTTDPISLGMIWRTNFGLITISMLGAPGILQRTNYGGYVNQLLPWSFLVSKEYFLACMPRFERKSKSYRCSLLVVSKMYQIAGKRSGSKPMMLLLSHSCPHCIGPWLYFLLKTRWEPGIVDSRESLSLFHLLTPIGQGLVVVFGCVWWGFCFVVGSVPLPSLTFLFVTVV